MALLKRSGLDDSVRELYIEHVDSGVSLSRKRRLRAAQSFPNPVPLVLDELIYSRRRKYL